MSVPTEFDFALIKLGDGASTEAFTTICGMQDVSINETVNTNDRFVRDCAAPASPPQRRVQVTGLQVDITGTGFTNADEVVRLRAALGERANYRVEGYADDGTATGSLIGTYSGSFVMTSKNSSLSTESPGSMEITLASDGATTYAAAT